jgi:signal peptidase II
MGFRLGVHMNHWARVTLIVMTLVTCVGCDQITKSLATHHLEGRGAASVLHDTLRLQYVRNPGAFLSLGASAPAPWRKAVFTVAAGIAIAALLVYGLLASSRGPSRVLALALICGGGIGNLIDRIRFEGYVVDFLNIGLGPVRTGIFNLADVALMAGASLLFVQWLLAPRDEVADSLP